MSNDTKVIYFMTDVHGPFDGEMVCERCGYTGTKEEIYERRRKFLSRCFRSRVKQKWKSLTSR